MWETETFHDDNSVTFAQERNSNVRSLQTITSNFFISIKIHSTIEKTQNVQEEFVYV